MPKSKRVFIIAEVSANHGQDFKKAVSMIRKAKACGADAIKFQTYTANTLTLNVDNKYFQVKHPKWGKRTLYQLYKKAYTPWSWFKKLKKVAEEEDILFFSTAFDKTSVDFLEELNVPIHKVASFELVDLPLVEHAARTKKPLILSTGLATDSEINDAVRTAKSAGAKNITLLKCVSSYPAKPTQMNLKGISRMKKTFKCPVGLSDHTMGIGVSIAAVALGAEVIEKHFTLSRKIKTPDSFFSIEPQELKELVDDIRIVEEAIGDTHSGLSEEEKKNLIFRRSLFAAKSIKKGEIFTHENVRSVRPGFGLPPKHLKSILNKRATKSIAKGSPLKLSLIK
ncbi:MAG: pseudaminic acid synthase [Candidatus Omnitrophica bacterium]|nr:pseudaminic acid synthase [Candidatus Omnitrophota bacterium]